MADQRQRPDPVLCQQICAYIRAGGYAPVAAEAAGVPAAVFHDWMERGTGRGARDPYRTLAERVRHAHAHARCMAEVARDFLRSGPLARTVVGVIPPAAA